MSGTGVVSHLIKQSRRCRSRTLADSVEKHGRENIVDYVRVHINSILLHNYTKR